MAETLRLKIFARLCRAFFLVVLFSACAESQTPKRAADAIKRQTPNIQAELSDKSLELGAPVFIRIVKTVDGSKTDGYLELFLANSEGRFERYKRWPICYYSGELGPKLKQGDGQSPEGFYYVKPAQMNPFSSYHLSFNLGYPNAFDRAHGRTGDYLMVHGRCVSIGCYAMTDDVIEEIWTLMSAAFDNGQPFVRVHAFPFPMTEENLKTYRDDANYPFWENLKSGWDRFETHKRPPNVTVRNKAYRFD